MHENKWKNNITQPWKYENLHICSLFQEKIKIYCMPFYPIKKYWKCLIQVFTLLAFICRFQKVFIHFCRPKNALVIVIFVRIHAYPILSFYFEPVVRFWKFKKLNNSGYDHWGLPSTSRMSNVTHCVYPCLYPWFFKCLYFSQI